MGVSSSPPFPPALRADAAPNRDWIKVGASVIKKVKGGYKVLSESASRNLGGPYKSKKQAVKRLRQVEYFKHQKGRG